jgi:hypothetical protein
MLLLTVAQNAPEVILECLIFHGKHACPPDIPRLDGL